MKAVEILTVFFRFMTPCSLVYGYLRFSTKNTVFNCTVNREVVCYPELILTTDQNARCHKPGNHSITCHVTLQVKGKAIPLQPWKGLRGFQKVEAPRFQDNRHMKVVRLSFLCTGHLHPQEIFLVLISVRN